MSALLPLLLESPGLSVAQMAEVLGQPVAAVEAELDALRQQKILLGFRPVLHPNTSASNQVRAVIEVKVQPQREGGFDRTAERIARFAEVESCYLMSGGYDLMIIVKGANLLGIATFVAEKLSSIPGVIGTSSSFQLKAYKEQGWLLDRDQRDPDKPAISP